MESTLKGIRWKNLKDNTPDEGQVCFAYDGWKDIRVMKWNTDYVTPFWEPEKVKKTSILQHFSGSHFWKWLPYSEGHVLNGFIRKQDGE